MAGARKQKQSERCMIPVSFDASRKPMGANLPERHGNLDTIVKSSVARLGAMIVDQWQSFL